MKSNLQTHQVRHLRISPAICVPEDMPVRDAIGEMHAHRVGCILVCRKDQLLGILTEVDVLRKGEVGQARWREPVRTLMTPTPVSISADASIWEAAKAMTDGGFRHLPVLDGAGKPIGFLSIRQIVTYLADQFPDTIYTLPPNPDTVPETAEGA